VRNRTHLGRASVAILALLALATGCSAVASSGSAATMSAASRSAATGSASAESSSGSAGPAAAVPTPDHVVVVVFENKDARSVIGAGTAPYLNGLAATGTTLRNAHGVDHPSQPNYLALFSGSTQGVTDDSCPRTFRSENLAGQLRAAGKSFVGYSEDLPRAGYTGCTTGNYARKHNPWVDFPALPESVNQPFSAFPTDYATLPTIAFVVPDLCNDMHDCPVSTGDAWARQHLDGYVSWARTHNSLLVVTFDEDEGTAANTIPTFIVGPMVRSGTTDQPVDHYGLLRTLEDMYGLSPLGQAASATPLTGIWAAG
jgi:hypothetical protein